MEDDRTHAAGALSGILETLKNDPDLLERLKAVLSPAVNAAEVSTDGEPPSDRRPVATDFPTDTDTQDAAPVSAPHPADGLSEILSDPAMLERLPQIMAVVKPLLASSGALEHKGAQHPAKPQNDRDALLLALKPFLSPARQDAVDTILRIGRLGVALKQIR